MRSGRKKKRSDDNDSIASSASRSTRASRASRRSSTSALEVGSTTRSRKRKSEGGGESDVPKEIKGKRRKKKELEVVDEDVEMEERVKDVAKQSAKKADKSNEEEDDVSDLEMEETKEAGSDEKKEEDADMEEQEVNDEVVQATGDNGDNGVNKTQAATTASKPYPPPVGTTTLQRLAQGLRLPSQHTPKLPTTNLTEGMTPAPPGGRRLFFETAKKKENRLLLNLREQDGTTDERGIREGQMEEDVDSPPDLERTPLQFDDGATKKDAISYLTTWTVLLIGLFIVNNVTGLNIFPWWNVRHNASLKSQEDNTTVIDVPAEPKIIENIVQLVDPSVLGEMKNKMRVQRRKEHELNKVNSAIEQTQKDLNTINKLMQQLSAESPELAQLLASDSLDTAVLSTDSSDINMQLKSLRASTSDKQSLLSEWEEVLSSAERSMEKFVQGEIDHAQMNSVLHKLSRSSLIGAPARILDTSAISLPLESCVNKDYTHTVMKIVNKDEEIDVVGGIDIEALDNASDSPVRTKDARAAFNTLLKQAQSRVASLVGQGPSEQVKKWVRHVIDGEWKKNGLDAPLGNSFEPLVAPNKQSVSANINSYTKLDALNDIDRLLEVESADRTGEFDHATVTHGARVLRRGPYATSPSLYESLPLFNRILAYAKLRFYGHPPEVALLPSSRNGRGQCWSFTEEKNRSTNGEVRGEYATLTVSLDAPTFVTEVVVEHRPSGDMSSAIREFRVLGFEDGGAFGEPFELGSFQYDTAGE